VLSLLLSGLWLGCPPADYHRQGKLRFGVQYGMWSVPPPPGEESEMAAQGRSLTDRLLEIFRNWWPVAAFLVPVLVAQTLWSGRYEVAGHAVGHLQSATPVFPMIFLSAVLLWALPGRGRRDRLLWLLLAAAIASCLVVLVGNVRVVEAIDGATWTNAQASQLGPARPGFESGHDLAQLGAWGAVLATTLTAGLLWQRRLVSAKVAAAAAVVSVVVPSFIAPGAGMVVLAVSAAVAHARGDRRLARGSVSLS
jgi:hypothetical protein